MMVAMNFDLVRPCGDCPFRSDKRAYLRPERVREILGGGCPLLMLRRFARSLSRREFSQCEQAESSNC
jgi:hypothetical protein